VCNSRAVQQVPFPDPVSFSRADEAPLNAAAGEEFGVFLRLRQGVTKDRHGGVRHSGLWCCRIHSIVHPRSPPLTKATGR
jgi:hypothetical protein